MNDDIRARFLPLFRETAKGRLARVRSPGESDAPMVMGELHALAGEAAVLGLKRVAELAQAAEARWRLHGRTSDGAWAETLAVLERAIGEA